MYLEDVRLDLARADEFGRSASLYRVGIRNHPGPVSGRMGIIRASCVASLVLGTGFRRGEVRLAVARHDPRDERSSGKYGLELG
jgi:hypothetical protein